VVIETWAWVLRFRSLLGPEDGPLIDPKHVALE
jgi:hypothetical protein